MALELALHREMLVSALFGGRATPSTAIPPHFGQLAMAPANGSGAHPGFGDAETNASAARKAWIAAGGETLGPVTIELPSAFDPMFSAGGTIAGRLGQVLGSEFRVAVDSYPQIARKAADHYYGNGRPAFWFGWGPSIGEPGVARWLNETYASSSANAAVTGFRSASVDTLLAALRDTLDAGQRALIAYNLVLALAADREGGVITWAVPTLDVLSRNSMLGYSAETFSGHVSDVDIHV
jgi:hypothetical protein